MSGCLLPFLIIFNLFFGWIFLKPLHWLLLEAVLVILFALSGFILIKRVTLRYGRPGKRSGKGRGNVIDTEGKVIK
ncbi:MAG: hypothetical protein WC532_06945 [Candidatus Omnitrophota bacterium]